MKLLSKKELEEIGIYIDCHGAINPDNEVEIWFGKSRIPPWEKYKRQKNNPLHCKWRMRIFERDNYICQLCKKRGGKLEAHHIKSFKYHKNLRYKIENGITLCKECHKEIHRRING
jgi:5-methylcytosine-specific restriction endonuclease McrA